MEFLEVLILGLIEGATEFVPVSSTGHMILASYLMKLENTDFLKTFEVVIQLGAILAIVGLYKERFLNSFTIYLKLLVAFIPTGIIGLLAYSTIKYYLFSPLVVAVSLIAGGVVLILLDKKVEGRESAWVDLEKISYKNAFYIGLIQCFSMIPGVSRAAATIIGGAFNGFNKKQAAEFSFLLAVPTMFAASGYDLLKTNMAFSQENILMLLAGMVVAFIAAWIAVKIFLKLLQQFGFKQFGYYRIAIGLVFLLVFFWFNPDYIIMGE
jgi:undecaprenyl-diphosphatase